MAQRRSELRVYMPRALIDALEHAAQRQFSNVSVYARQVLSARLVADGLLSPDAGDRAGSGELGGADHSNDGAH